MGSLPEDDFNDFFRDEVGEAKVGTGERDEADDDGCGLRDLTAIGPLHTL